MKDVQKEYDPRNIQIDRVGVRNVSCPITALYHDGGTQSTIARLSMSVMLPREYRGTHMSRFIETLEEYRGRVSPHNLEAFTRRLCEKLNASESSLIVEFPYYFRKKAPVSGIESFSKCDVNLEADYSEAQGFDMIIGLSLNVQTLCPCSKEISDYGAHNQRALVSLKVRCKGLVWFEELIEMIESSASSPLYTLLKREDEKYITERAYENPRFVEDVTRELAVKLDNDDRITWYSVNVESMESIHDHNAFAELERDKMTS
ncbi:MAG: GTP cyclohydrolase I FolE2 [Synergistaceae bacterium]|nr:GTP cyclohydrolase I FolE2 [Synergistaceae bacterium]